jgi:hypothetical protein
MVSARFCSSASDNPVNVDNADKRDIDIVASSDVVDIGAIWCDGAR